MSDTIHLLKVVHITQLAPQIIQLLTHPEMPIRYQAGDYVMLGFDTSDLKPFLIASAPREDGLLEFHIRKQPDSEWMERLFAIETGDQLVMQGPKKQMQLTHSDQPMIFVAGGTGFAPMKALLEELLRQDNQQTIKFYWGARTTADLYMHEYMQALATSHSNLEYFPVISDDCHDWTGKTGLVHLQVIADHENLADYQVFLCGPWAMQQTAKQDFLAAGLPPDHFMP